eukprot:10769235-Alexandrium_andersonii.AAC.2
MHCRYPTGHPHVKCCWRGVLAQQAGVASGGSVQHSIGVQGRADERPRVALPELGAKAAHHTEVGPTVAPG